MQKKTIVLLVLDGFGHREALAHNAIAMANTPCWDAIWRDRPRVLLDASGEAVGLPAGQMGNSEVGHLTLGSGRVIFQDLPRIDQAIQTAALAQHPDLIKTFEQLKQNGKTLHLIGLLSDGGVHSHERHLFALMHLAKQAGLKSIQVHAILDGRDTPPQSAATSIERLLIECEKTGATLGTLQGRYYAMDRDKHNDRTHLAYTLLTEGKALYTAQDGMTALTSGYHRGETDEFIHPTVLSEYRPMVDGDALCFFNFRSDRMRQLAAAMTLSTFEAFPRARPIHFSATLSMRPYADHIPTTALFPSLPCENTLGEWLSKAGLRQLRLAETEKYAHVTFFFNGGKEAPYPGEDRQLIPSLKVPTHDLAPGMQTQALADALRTAILSEQYDFILCNWANPDMVGHTGKWEPTIQAIESVDKALASLLPLFETDKAACLITADHGNAECLFDEQNGQPHTAHTSNPVPCVYVGTHPCRSRVKQAGLMDVAPSILALKGLPIPKEMTGQPLFE